MLSGYGGNVDDQHHLGSEKLGAELTVSIVHFAHPFPWAFVFYIDVSMSFRTFLY